MQQDSDVVSAGNARRRRSRRSRRGQRRGLRALQRKIANSPLVKWVPLVFLCGYASLALFNWYGDAVRYLDVDLGGSRDQALYALGPSPTVNATSGGGERLDFLTDQGAMVSVALSADGKIGSVRCSIEPEAILGCPAMFGVAPGDSEGSMYGWLGVPDRISVSGDVLTADYTSLGVKFELRQFKIVAVTHYSGGSLFGHALRFLRHLVFLPGGVV